jgi:hypothetical protein
MDGLPTHTKTARYVGLSFARLKHALNARFALGLAFLLNFKLSFHAHRIKMKIYFVKHVDKLNLMVQYLSHALHLRRMGENKMSNLNNINPAHLDRICGLFPGTPVLDRARQVRKQFSLQWRVTFSIDGVETVTTETSIDPRDPVELAALAVEQQLLVNDDRGDPIPERITITIERAK